MKALDKVRIAFTENARIRQAQDWYQSQTARDQLVVRLVLGLLIMAVIFSIFVAPLIRQNGELSKELETKTQFYELMAQNGARFSGSLPRSSNIDKPILAVVSQQAKRDQIQLTRYEQDGESLRVWVDNTSFDDAAQWVERLSRTQGVQVGQINIDRKPEPGRVDLRVTFIQG